MSTSTLLSVTKTVVYVRDAARDAPLNSDVGLLTNQTSSQSIGYTYLPFTLLKQFLRDYCLKLIIKYTQKKFNPF